MLVHSVYTAYFMAERCSIMLDNLNFQHTTVNIRSTTIRGYDNETILIVSWISIRPWAAGRTLLSLAMRVFGARASRGHIWCCCAHETTGSETDACVCPERDTKPLLFTCISPALLLPKVVNQLRYSYRPLCPPMCASVSPPPSHCPLCHCVSTQVL
jgi:hypothetical protein